jgi:hypothetical protein
MENPRLLKPERRASFLKLTALWAGIVVALASLGFVGPGLSNQIHGDAFNASVAVEAIVLFGALGCGIATCVTAGVAALSGAYHGRTRRGPAILSLAAISAGSGIAIPLVIGLAKAVSRGDILQGEAGLAIITVTGYGMLAVATSFVVFSVFILAKRNPANGRAVDDSQRKQ